LVVEAAVKSGSLSTASWAADQGREVFAVPGSVHSPVSAGCHRLIRDGAKLVETPDEVLAELRLPLVNQWLENIPRIAGQSPLRRQRLDKPMEILLDAVGFGPTGVDELVIRTGLPGESVASMLLILELEGLIAAEAGGRYSRTPAI
jgi:DNA processing protein